jgi:hypothetical protein
MRDMMVCFVAADQRAEYRDVEWTLPSLIVGGRVFRRREIIDPVTGMSRFVYIACTEIRIECTEILEDAI